MFLLQCTAYCISQPGKWDVVNTAKFDWVQRTTRRFRNFVMYHINYLFIYINGIKGILVYSLADRERSELFSKVLVEILMKCIIPFSE